MSTSVKSRHLQCKRSCPRYPQRQTFSGSQQFSFEYWGLCDADIVCAISRAT